jgi:hypothetical protein
VNKEALPLIFAILIPIILVSLILLYFYGYDVTLFFRQIDIIYYIIVFPIALGCFNEMEKSRINSSF